VAREEDLGARVSVSATQIETWQSCPRKWAFQYLANLPRKPDEALNFGDRYHKNQAEPWLRDYRAPDQDTPEGRLFLCTVPHLPKPGTCQVESKYRFIWEGIEFSIRRDFTLPPSIVGDHKTTSATKWVPSPAGLLVKVQPNLYALGSCLEWHVAEVHLQWIYAVKGTATCIPVCVWQKKEISADWLRRSVLLDAQAIEKSWRLGQCSLDQCNNDFEARDSCFAYNKPCDFTFWCTQINKEKVISMPTVAELRKQLEQSAKAQQAPVTHNPVLATEPALADPIVAEPSTGPVPVVEAVEQTAPVNPPEGLAKRGRGRPKKQAEPVEVPAVSEPTPVVETPPTEEPQALASFSLSVGETALYQVTITRKV